MQLLFNLFYFAFVIVITYIIIMCLRRKTIVHGVADMLWRVFNYTTTEQLYIYRGVPIHL